MDEFYFILNLRQLTYSVLLNHFDPNFLDFCWSFLLDFSLLITFPFPFKLNNKNNTLNCAKSGAWAFWFLLYPSKGICKYWFDILILWNPVSSGSRSLRRKWVYIRRIINVRNVISIRSWWSIGLSFLRWSIRLRVLGIGESFFNLYFEFVYVFCPVVR